jgi:hypothetical protein
MAGGEHGMNTDYFVDLRDGRFEQTTKEQMDDMFVRLAKNGTKQLAVHFHGGLVSRQGIHKSMEKVLIEHYRATGTHPYFFVWNSDLGTTITANLDEIAKEKAFQRLLLKVIEFVSGKLLQAPDTKGILSFDAIPESSLDQLAAEADRREQQWRQSSLPAEDFEQSEANFVQAKLKSDPILAREAKAIAVGTLTPVEIVGLQATKGAAAVNDTRTTLISPALLERELIQTNSPDTRSIGALLFFAKHGLSIASRILRRFMHQRDHGLYRTAVEELVRELYLDNVGIMAWNMMKQDTADAFGDDAQKCGGTRFAMSLAKAMREAPYLRVTFIGHSTGAIYITNLLKALDPQLEAKRKVDVIFLAPALKMATFADNLGVYQRRVDNFRMFALNEARETGYWEVPGIYKGSLLYLVSGIFEEAADKAERGDVPLLGMQRYAKPVADGPYDLAAWKAARTWLALDTRSVWAGDPATGVPGYMSDAVKHGGIDDNDAQTLASIKHMLKKDA